MKTKKGLNGLRDTSSVPWRNVKKGTSAQAAKKSPEDGPRFRIGEYIRLSPTGDDREEGSLISHPQRIRQFVESKNIQHGGTWGEIVATYQDKDLSGKDMNRPAFQKMLADVAAGKINAVIVTELSRLNRKVRDFCEVWEFFKEKDCALFCLKENFDTSTPMGELMLIQAMSFAQFERHSIVDRVKRGARARAERGLAHGGLLLGFKLVEHRPNYRKVDAQEKVYVQMIFRKFLELKKLSELVSYLNGNGYRTKEYTTKEGKKMGGNRWTIGSVHSLLTNRAYIGQREVNKKSRGLDPSNLKEEETYFYVDAHWPALVSEDLFSDVQNLLERNRKRARKYVHEYRLTGLIECKDCGAPLIGKSGTGKLAKYFYYGHKRKILANGDRHLERCSIENVPAVSLEEAVIHRIKDLATDPKLIKSLAAKTQSQVGETVAHQKAVLAGKEQERRKLDQKLRNLYEAISEESDRDLRLALSYKAKETKASLDQIQSTIDTLRDEYERLSKVVDVSAVFELMKTFRTGAFEKLDVSAQAEIIRDRVRRIVVHENGIYVELFGEPTGTPGGRVGTNTTQTAFSRTSRSGVRTVSKLVQSAGLEPATI